MLGKIGNKLERIEEEIFEGEGDDVVRDISNAKQEIINFRKIVRPQRLAFRDLERNKARYIAEDLDIYFDDIIDASERALGHARELQGGRRGPRGHQRVGDRAPHQRDLPRPDRDLADLPAADADRQRVRHERARPVRGLPHAFWIIIAVMLAIVIAVADVLPQARLAVTGLEGVEALARDARPKRMLVIINPVATKMSDRLKSLVVYALQGRYDVTTRETEAKGHAIELCREAAADSATTSWSPSAATARSTRPPTAWPASRTALTCLPGGSNNVVAKLLGIPTDVVDATEHLLDLADRWAPRTVDLGIVNGRYFTFAAGMGLDASVVERVDRNPRLKKRFGPFYFVECAIVDVPAQVRRQPAAARGRGRRAHGRRRQPVRAERRELHVLQRPRRCRWSRARALTRAAWPASC